MIITSSNLDYLITPVRMHVGDLTEVTFSDSVILTALVYAVKYLQNRWNNRYLIYTSGMIVTGTTVNTPNGTCDLASLPGENDAFRNCHVTFTSAAPPIIDQNDELPIILVSAINLRRSVITSSIHVFSNWSTPDLSFSNVSSSKSLEALINADLKLLDDFFKKRLATPQKSTFPIAGEENVVQFVQTTVIYPEIIVTET